MSIPVLEEPTGPPVETAPPVPPAALEPLAWGRALRYGVANLGAQAVYALFNFAMPFYLQSYHVPPALIGLLANERSFVGAFVQPVVGRLSDRTRTPLGRRRPYFLIGIPLMSLALFALATHPDFWVMMGIMTIAAFFLSVAWDPYMAFMADLFTPEQRGRVGGLIGVGAGIGTLLTLVLALTLWGSQEFLVFGLIIIFLIATWAFTFFTVKEPAVPEAAEARPAQGFSPLTYVRSLLPYPEAAKYTLAITFFWLGTGGAVPFITLFGQHALHASEQDTFILPLAAVVTNALASLPIGFLADRIGKKRVMTMALALFAVFALIGSQSQTLWQGVIALAFIGVANAGMNQINPMLTDLVPKPRVAEFVGLGSAVFSFAQPLGSVVVGGVVTLASQMVGLDAAYRWSFICSGLLVLVAAGLLQLVRPERARTD